MADLDPSRYSPATRRTVARLNLDRINPDLIHACIRWILESFSSTPGAILVFLAGLSDIQNLLEILPTDPKLSSCVILPLHSLLTSQEQNKVFEIPASPSIRKIILSTNIAETGVTIPDVTFVIDSGKEKTSTYDESTRTSSLKETPTTSASATQRKGRAGRTRPGFCFRLYTFQYSKTLPSHPPPELLRVPLDQLCLHILSAKFGDPRKFLSKAITPPTPNAIETAMAHLERIGALQFEEEKQLPRLTSLGSYLSLLPVDPHIGKIILFGAAFQVLDPMLTIAAAISHKSKCFFF
jgi:ATP-dependent RNA helicase DHX29